MITGDADIDHDQVKIGVSASEIDHAHSLSFCCVTSLLPGPPG